MSIASIQKGIEERFAKPLPEFATRRIVFWEDPEQMFGDEIDQLQLDGIKILKLTGNNYFEVKKRLLCDDPDSDYLLYQPFEIYHPKEDWLIDIRSYSGEPFYADKMSLQMDEFGIDSTPEMRRALKHYPKFFDNRERADKLKSFGKVYSKPYDLHLDILCVLCGIPSGSIQNVITALLFDGTDKDCNSSFYQISRFGDPAVLWSLIHRTTGYEVSEDEYILSDLLAHIFFTATAHTISVDLKQLSDYISLPHASFCYSLVHEMLYYSSDEKVYQLCAELENRFNLAARFSKLDVLDIVECDIFPCINTCILKHYLTDIGRDIIKAEEIQKVVETRRTLKWYDSVQPCFEGLFQIANMQLFYQQYAGTFHETEPLKVWKQYTGEFYKMDAYYRKFHLAFASIGNVSDELIELFKTAADVVETLYQNWFLKDLNKMWFNAAEDYLLDYQKANIRLQNDFYNTFVRKEKENHTVFVIISDAFRYEVAHQLVSELELQNRGKVKLESVKSVFPSVTNYGMTALLPGKNKAVSENNELTVDGLSCKSTEQRKAVLKATDSASTAIQYKAFIDMKKDERNAFITGNKVVYIYHNTIDAVGDKLQTEYKVFSACEEAVTELQTLIKTLSGLRGSSMIIVTADHGFMYTYSPLNESQKLSKADLTGTIESGRRYVVGTEATQSELLAPVQMELNNAECSLIGFSPRDTIRLKMSGGGSNYVHGGASLQEMCVPVLTFKSVRKDSKEYQNNKNLFDSTPVEIILLATARKISNMAFSYYFLQTEPVGRNKHTATYRLFFTDQFGNKVSDVQKIVADRNGSDQLDRQFRCSFRLKSMKYNKNSKYYLICLDENDDEKMHIEFQIDIPYVTDDFDF